MLHLPCSSVQLNRDHWEPIIQLQIAVIFFFFNYRCGAKPWGKTAELLQGNIHKVIDRRDSQLQTWAHRVLSFSFVSVIYMSLQHLAMRMHANDVTCCCCSQCMRSQYCCRCYQQLYWHLMSLKCCNT
jgi:hypothetical protein